MSGGRRIEGRPLPPPLIGLVGCQVYTRRMVVVVVVVVVVLLLLLLLVLLVVAVLLLLVLLVLLVLLALLVLLVLLVLGLPCIHHRCCTPWLTCAAWVHRPRSWYTLLKDPCCEFLMYIPAVHP